MYQDFGIWTVFKSHKNNIYIHVWSKKLARSFQMDLFSEEEEKVQQIHSFFWGGGGVSNLKVLGKSVG